MCGVVFEPSVCKGMFSLNIMHVVIPIMHVVITIMYVVIRDSCNVCSDKEFP